MVGPMDDWTEIDTLPNGRMQDSNGQVYARTPRRIRRALGTELIESGAIVVTDVYPEGPRAFEGSAAKSAWALIAPRLTEGKSGRVTNLEWTGHVYESDDGHTLLYFSGAH